MDPLHDPDDDALLDPRRARALAELVEHARLASAAVRYGRIGTVGVAHVVINEDNPLPGGDHACGLWGTLAEVASTLLRLEHVFAEAGRREAVVYATPTTVAEIDGIADDAGWRAVEENLALLHRCVDNTTAHPAVREATEDDLPGVAALLAEETGLTERGEIRLVRHLRHRWEDQRCHLHVVDDHEADRIIGFAQTFHTRGIGLLEHVVTHRARRRRGWGTTLTNTATATLRDNGARLVTAHCEEGGVGQRFAESCHLDPTYPTTTYTRRIDELVE